MKLIQSHSDSVLSPLCPSHEDRQTDRHVQAILLRSSEVFLLFVGLFWVQDLLKFAKENGGILTSSGI